jgi:biotin carboxylase
MATSRRGAVLVVEPASSGTTLLAEAADLGLDVIVASHDHGDRRLADEHRIHVDTMIRVDTNDDDALTSAVLAFAGSRPLDAVVPGFEFYVPAAARLARKLGLPGLDPWQALACRNKTMMRETVRAAGLRVPAFAAAVDAATLQSAAAGVGYPCVLKPTSSAGSVHVRRVDDWSQLRRAYDDLRNDERLDFGRGLDGDVLVEEYVEGDEVSVEGVVTDGHVDVAAVTSKLLGPEPFFVEIGHIVPAELSPTVRKGAVDYATDVVKALGITLGPFHCEMRLTPKGPVLIELGARLPGDHIVDLVRLTTGVSLPRRMLMAYAGLSETADPAPPAAAVPCAGVRYFIAPGLAQYRAVAGMGSATAQPWLVDAALDIAPLTAIPPPEDFRCRLGHAVFTADDHAQALRRWHWLGEEIRFVA